MDYGSPSICQMTLANKRSRPSNIREERTHSYMTLVKNLLFCHQENLTFKDSIL